MATPHIIDIDGKVRIRRLNHMNALVERFVETEGHEPRWVSANGDGRGPFLQDEVSACRWILAHGLLDEGGERSLAEALEQYGRIAGQLADAVRAALAIGDGTASESLEDDIESR